MVWRLYYCDSNLANISILVNEVPLAGLTCVYLCLSLPSTSIHVSMSACLCTFLENDSYLCISITTPSYHHGAICSVGVPLLVVV